MSMPIAFAAPAKSAGVSTPVRGATSSSSGENHDFTRALSQASQPSSKTPRAKVSPSAPCAQTTPDNATAPGAEGQVAPTPEPGAGQAALIAAGLTAVPSGGWPAAESTVPSDSVSGAEGDEQPAAPSDVTGDLEMVVDDEAGDGVIVGAPSGGATGAGGGFAPNSGPVANGAAGPRAGEAVSLNLGQEPVAPSGDSAVLGAPGSANSAAAPAPTPALVAVPVPDTRPTGTPAADADAGGTQAATDGRTPTSDVPHSERTGAAAHTPTELSAGAASQPSDPQSAAAQRGGISIEGVGPIQLTQAASAPAPLQAVRADAEAPTLAEQMRAPILNLRTAAAGEHVITMRVQPEQLGPVQVRAHIGPEGIRIELVGATDAGREGLRAILTDLRRDLAAGGMNAQLDLGANSTFGRGAASDADGAHQPGGQPRGGDAASGHSTGEGSATDSMTTPDQADAAYSRGGVDILA